MNEQLKSIVAKLPMRLQQRLKRMYFAYQIKRSRFYTDEPEFDLCADLISGGDWVVDIGANIGHYTLLFSKLVGPTGRVIAVEPIPETFELLCANVALLDTRNTTLINAAASDETSIAGMRVPKLDSGLDNFYMAAITSEFSDTQVLCFPFDRLNIPNKIKLVKIDAEGHDFAALQGMRELLQRDRPIIFIEDDSERVQSFLVQFGYSKEKLTGSPNVIYSANYRKIS